MATDADGNRVWTCPRCGAVLRTARIDDMGWAIAAHERGCGA